MARKKKEKKVIVIGSMVVNVGDNEDLGKGDEYAMTTMDDKKQLFPTLRKDIDVQETVETSGTNPDGSPMTKTQTTKKPLTTCGSYMHFVWDLFEDTEGSKVSSYINFWIMFLIVCSAIVAVVETIPSIHKSQEELWFWLETIFVFFFTVEFVGRVISCPSKFVFATTLMNYIDLVAILPYYMDIISMLLSTGGDPPNFGFLRILRLSRAARLIKLSKYSQGIRLVTNAMANSVDALQLFALLLTLVLVVFSSGIYYTERGEWIDETDGCPNIWYTQFCMPAASNFNGRTYNYTVSTSPTVIGKCLNTCITNRYYRKNTLVGGNDQVEQFPSPFQSIPQSFWWCIVTLTTVGYGDMYPYSVEGKIVGVLTMLVGLIMLALPLSIIGTNFIEERNIMVEENKRRVEEERKAALGVAQVGEAEPVEEEEVKEDEPKYKMRKDLREVLAKADQLYESTGYMAEQLTRCAHILKQMRSYKIQPPGGDKASTGSGNGAGVGSGGAGQTEVSMNDVSVDMPGSESMRVAVYAVPVPAMEELKGLCLSVLQKAIGEMKIWDPQGELPEMPTQILDLLTQANAGAKMDPRESNDFWKSRLASYEDVANNPVHQGGKSESMGGRFCAPAEQPNNPEDPSGTDETK